MSYMIKFSIQHFVFVFLTKSNSLYDFITFPYQRVYLDVISLFILTIANQNKILQLDPELDTVTYF